MVGMADALLRAGRVEPAIDWFERAIETDPAAEPYLWQYGIALCFANRFDDGAALFEKHRAVNPHDVENAAWHFLCVARSKGLDQARSMTLPAPGDSRVPMEQVLIRLKGGDWGPIDLAVSQLEGTARHADAMFYRDLYQGLISDAEGRQVEAQKFMTKAAGTPATHYMADVARVYAKQLNDNE